MANELQMSIMPIVGLVTLTSSEEGIKNFFETTIWQDIKQGATEAIKNYRTQLEAFGIPESESTFIKGAINSYRNLVMLPQDFKVALECEQNKENNDD